MDGANVIVFEPAAIWNALLFYLTCLQPACLFGGWNPHHEEWQCLLLSNSGPALLLCCSTGRRRRHLTRCWTYVIRQKLRHTARSASAQKARIHKRMAVKIARAMGWGPHQGWNLILFSNSQKTRWADGKNDDWWLRALTLSWMLNIDDRTEVVICKLQIRLELQQGTYRSTVVSRSATAVFPSRRQYGNCSICISLSRMSKTMVHWLNMSGLLPFACTFQHHSYDQQWGGLDGLLPLSPSQSARRCKARITHIVKPIVCTFATWTPFAHVSCLLTWKWN